MKSSTLSFEKEDWDVPAEVFDGLWVIANRHGPGLNRAFQVNNRVFVFRLKNRAGQNTLLVFGCGCSGSLEAVRAIEKKTGLKVSYIVGNGGAHHLFLGLWFDAFPEARVLIPAKRIPGTRNGIELQKKYADRWELMYGPRPIQLVEEFGEELDSIIFDQLFTYRDQFHAELGGAKDHRSPEQNVGGFKLLGLFAKTGKDLSQPTDEVFLFHKRSGLVIAGHNYQFIYEPVAHKPLTKHRMKRGGFPMSFLFKMILKKGQFVSSLEGQPAPIADSKIHAEAWEAVLAWELKAWTSCHNPPQVIGPDMTGTEIKEAVRASLHRSGEDDPTGARLKWNIKHGLPALAQAAE